MTPSASANGTSDGIVWAIETVGEVQAGAAAVLYAYDASDVASELYNNNRAGTLDVPGTTVKFLVSTITNGRHISVRKRISTFMGCCSACQLPDSSLRGTG